MKGRDPESGVLDTDECFDTGPSPVPGIPRYRFDAMAEDILWFGRLPLRERLRAIQEGIERVWDWQRWERVDGPGA